MQCATITSPRHKYHNKFFRFEIEAQCRLESRDSVSLALNAAETERLEFHKD